MNALEFALHDLARARETDDPNDAEAARDEARVLTLILLVSELRNCADAFTRIAGAVEQSLEHRPAGGSPPPTGAASVEAQPDT